MPRPIQAGAKVEVGAALIFGDRVNVLVALSRRTEGRFYSRYRRVYPRSRDRGDINAIINALWPLIVNESLRMLGDTKTSVRLRDVRLDTIIQEIMIGLDTLARSYHSRVLLNRRKQLADPISQPRGIAQRSAVRLARRLVTFARQEMFKVLYQAAGANLFEWVTTMDGRERPAHAMLNGQIFGMQTGAGGIFPGQPYNCRCLPRPVRL